MSPDAQPHATSTAGQPSWMAPVTPVIPDHELVRRIGGGSYGDVWLARTTVGTWRAAKVVFRDRFTDSRPYEREFSGMLKFEPLSRGNEAFVDILQIGRNDADGYFYYVMELADDAAAAAGSDQCSVISNQSGAQHGAPSLTTDHSSLNTGFAPATYVPKTLSKVLLQRGRLPAGECLELGLTLNLGLAHLHRAGLIHRDIKPSNLIFVGGVPKLADIGLVIEVAEARSFVGTEGFIPPEGPNSPQADLYSLGKVLYEASMGKDRKDFPEPFTQLTEAPDSPQLLEFNAILLKACAANQTERYQSAEEMNADLALLQSGGSVRQQRKVARQLRFVRRVGALVAALAAVIALGWWWQARQTAKVRELANEMSRLAHENRRQVVRLGVANGVRLWEAGDSAGALLWFADALSRVTPDPAEESVHRIRLQQVLHHAPRFSQVLAHDAALLSGAFSTDGDRIVAGSTYGRVLAWDVRSGEPLWPPVSLGKPYLLPQARFTRDGASIAVSSLPVFGFHPPEFAHEDIVALLDAATGRQRWSLTSTNWLRSQLSPDDRWWVLADTDHVIRVHDAKDGRQLSELRGHAGRILQFAMNADGSVLASSSAEDRTIRLWRLPAGEPVGSPIRLDDRTGPMALNDAGTLLAATTTGPEEAPSGTVRILKVATGAPVGPVLRFERQSMKGLHFAGTGGRHLFVLTDQQCQLLDPRTLEPHGRPLKLPPETHAFSLSPDERYIALGGGHGLAGVWSLETGLQILPACLTDRALTELSFSPDGRRLLATAADGSAVILSAEPPAAVVAHRFGSALSPGSPKPLQEWRRFTPDARFFLLILADGTVHQVDFERMTAEPIPAADLEGLRALQATFDLTGHRRAIFYTGDGRQVVELWTEQGGATRRFLLPHPTGLSDKMVFTLDGSRLLTPGADGRIRCWKTADGSLQWTVSPNADGQVVLFPDGNTALGVSKDTRRFVLFDLAQGTERPASFGDVPFEMKATIFSPAADRFALAGDLRWSRIYDARTTEPLTPPLQHDGVVGFLHWSPDGRRITTAGATPEVRVWDTATGELLLPPLRLGTSAVETGLWSPDGRFIVARSDDNLVRVWDAATGEPVTPVLRHDGFVRFARIVANNRLITMSLPDVMRAWDLVETRLPAAVIADYARLISGRRLNAAGVPVALKLDEIAELNRSLHVRAPDLFR